MAGFVERAFVDKAGSANRMERRKGKNSGRRKNEKESEKQRERGVTMEKKSRR